MNVNEQVDKSQDLLRILTFFFNLCTMYVHFCNEMDSAQLKKKSLVSRGIVKRGNNLVMFHTNSILYSPALQ